MRANRVLIVTMVIAAGCSKASPASPVDGGDTPDAATCLSCQDGPRTPTLNPTFPPYGLTWTPTGELGRAGGLTWGYAGIQRGDLVHIYWVFCDDPMLPCGLSLDGPIDPSTESWQYNATQSNRASGKLVFTNTTHIVLADTSTPQLNGRLTVNITGPNSAPMFFNDTGSMHVNARDGIYGAEITGDGFQVTAVGEVQDPATQAWTPYSDYYDAQMTPDTGTTSGNIYTSFGGSFYDE